MPVNSREKGKSGEREIVKLLQAAFPEYEIKRNLREQAADGCADVIGLPHYSIEVKNHASPTQGAIAKWWEQAVEQGAKSRNEPVLFFKIPRQAWRVVTLDVSASALGYSDYDSTITMSVPLFVKRARSNLSAWALVESISDVTEIADCD